MSAVDPAREQERHPLLFACQPLTRASALNPKSDRQHTPQPTQDRGCPSPRPTGYRLTKPHPTSKCEYPAMRPDSPAGHPLTREIVTHRTLAARERVPARSSDAETIAEALQAAHGDGGCGCSARDLAQYALPAVPCRSCWSRQLGPQRERCSSISRSRNFTSSLRAATPRPLSTHCERSAMREAGARAWSWSRSLHRVAGWI